MMAIIFGLVSTTALVGGIAYYLKNYDIATGKHKSLQVGFGFICQYFPEKKNIVVVSRLLESPAGRAGMQRGDVLISWGGTDLTNIVNHADYQDRISCYTNPPLRPGSQQTLIWERDGVRHMRILKAEWVKKNFYVPPTQAEWGSSGLTHDRETGYHIPHSSH